MDLRGFRRASRSPGILGQEIEHIEPINEGPQHVVFAYPASPRTSMNGMMPPGRRGPEPLILQQAHLLDRAELLSPHGRAARAFSPNCSR